MSSAQQFLASLTKGVNSPVSNATSTSPFGNISLFAIPAVWVVSIAAHFYAAANAPTSGGFDNVSPRGYLASITRKEKRTPQEELYIRAEAAQQNGFENLPFFAAAILAGNVARLPVDFLNLSAVVYVGSRILYNVLYINTTSASASNLRSVVFLTGVGTCFTLFIRAGRAFQY
ncbi:hypothetical protein FA09DRAFT_340366 [Tilletiopsis washingtonensis]|uniref:Membrane-associated proteins in eicosanoid and glutathione metabolism n=1 Tax=Tilletiopsis washingtonensis TaxID=58919 RepID=A0A316Z5C5_9BASI|nr:hypothetical protein FA09DRAFT_340366 [Tilletiopsis washingtonensis]PWN96168.1 hypothetical protein FA09DRAFT_340366 [Tilletiopsis washingtonensis]